RLRVEGREVTGADEGQVRTSGIAWCGEATGVVASDLIAPEAEEQDAATKEAIDFLQEQLGEAPVGAEEVRRRLKRAGIAERAWKKAKRRLRVESVKAAFGGGWVWRLPQDEGGQRRGAESFTSQNPSFFGKNGSCEGANPSEHVEEGRRDEEG